MKKSGLKPGDIICLRRNIELLTASDVPLNSSTPSSYSVLEGTVGIFCAKAEGIPDVAIIEIEYGDKQTARVEAPFAELIV